MLLVIPSHERHHADFGWLSTRYHFSFNHYYDPQNVHWGVLRVFNDDVIQPGAGFPMHPHRDMEILTYVIDGILEHRDSLGHTGRIAAGEVQVMSAGTGIRHSESNASREHPLHLLQLWILPRRQGNPPRWEQRRFTEADRAGRLLPVASGDARAGTLTIDQDATVYLASLAPGEVVTHHTAAPRGYLFVIRGAVELNGTPLRAGDQARLAHEPTLKLAAREQAELILFDLAE